MRSTAANAAATTSSREVELQDVPERRHAVTPIDLLSLGIRPARVGDWHFVDACVALGKACRDFGLEPEPIRREVEGPGKLTAHGLVARFHVGEVEVGQH